MCKPKLQDPNHTASYSFIDLLMKFVKKSWHTPLWAY